MECDDRFECERLAFVKRRKVFVVSDRIAGVEYQCKFKGRVNERKLRIRKNCVKSSMMFGDGSHEESVRQRVRRKRETLKNRLKGK